MNLNHYLLSSLLLLQIPTIPIKAAPPSIAHNSICKIEAEGEGEFYSTKELQTLANQITVKVIGDNNGGSGTLIGKQGNNYLVLTNSHVVQGVNSIKLQTADGKTYSAEILPQNNFKNSDISLLKFQSSENYCLSEIAKATPDINTSILAAGFSGSTGNIAFSEGEVKKTSNLKEGYEIGYSSNIEQGMSGGAILNSMGELVGINGKSAYPILNTGYVYQNGKRPSEAEIQEMRKLSWGIPISTVLTWVDGDVLNAYKLPLPKGGRHVSETVYTGWLGELEQKAKQFTVRIDSNSTGNGSGIIIAREENTYTVLTSAHVLCERQDATKPCGDFKYEILAPDGNKYAVDESSIKIESGVDLAVVKFKSSEKYEIATLANYFPNRDDYMFTAGYPQLQDSYSPWRFTVGRISDVLHISQFESTNNNKDQLQKSSSSFITKGYELVYTSITSGGMSGGPILDFQGRVIGIHGASEAEEASDERVQLGYSLGIPISTFLGQQFGVKAQKLEKNTTLPELSEQKAKSIQEAVLSANVPTGNTQSSQWLERGNQLWRLGRYEDAVKAFDKAINQEPAFLHLAYYGKALAFGGLGREKKVEGAFENALKALKQAVKLKDDFVIGWNYLSVINRQLEKMEEGLVTIDKAIQLQPENPNLYHEKSVILRKIKRYEEAEEALNKAIDLYPNYSYYLNLGFVYDEQNKLDKALENYNKAIDINPYFALAYNNRALVYDDQKKFQLALKDYNKAIEINPKLDSAYNNRGNLYQEHKKWDSALVDYNKAIEIDSINSDYYNNRGNLYQEQKKWDLALADFNKAIDINSENVLAYNNRGHLYYKQKKWNLALADFNKAIDIDSKYAKAYNNRGNLYKKQKKWDLALADYNKAIDINSKYALVYNNRGNLYKKQKKWNLALADYNKAIDINSKHAGAYNNRGTLYQELKKLDLAFADYNKAIEINPKYADAYNNRGTLYHNKKWDLALADYNKAIEIDSKFAFAYHNRGNLYSAQNKSELALTDYNKAIEINPNNSQAYFSRGLIYTTQDKSDLALADFNKAIEINPNNAKVYFSRGLIYTTQDKSDLALTDYNKAIEINPKYAQAYYHRGNIYSDKNKSELALADFNKAIEFNIKNAQAYLNRAHIYTSQKKLDLALTDLNKAIKIKPNYAQAYFHRGVLYTIHKKSDLALADFNKVIEINPKFPSIYSFRGIAYYAQKNYSAAMSDYKQALLINQKDYLAIDSIGAIKYEQGEIETAIQQWQKSLEINNKSAGVNLALAVALYRKGEHEQAYKFAKTALKIDKKFADIKYLKENLWGEVLIKDTQKLFSSPKLKTLLSQQLQK
jgi:tetratricopeptide (TPR) repeat protein